MTNKNILNPDRIVFSFCVQDIQDCAEQEYGRELTAAEVSMVEKYIGKGAFEWYQNLDVIIGISIDRIQDEGDE